MEFVLNSPFGDIRVSLAGKDRGRASSGSLKINKVDYHLSFGFQRADNEEGFVPLQGEYFELRKNIYTNYNQSFASESAKDKLKKYLFPEIVKILSSRDNQFISHLEEIRRYKDAQAEVLLTLEKAVEQTRLRIEEYCAMYKHANEAGSSMAERFEEIPEFCNKQIFPHRTESCKRPAFHTGECSAKTSGYLRLEIQ